MTFLRLRQLRKLLNLVRLRVSQSDIDFFEEINLIRSKQENTEGISLVKPEDLETDEENEGGDSDSESEENYDEDDEQIDTGFSEN